MEVKIRSRFTSFGGVHPVTKVPFSVNLEDGTAVVEMEIARLLQGQYGVEIIEEPAKDNTRDQAPKPEGDPKDDPEDDLEDDLEGQDANTPDDSLQPSETKENPPKEKPIRKRSKRGDLDG